MKIIDYKIASSSKKESLGDRVKVDIKMGGWQPHGSPYLDRNGIEQQAMVRYEEVKTKTSKKAKKNEDQQ